MVAKVFVFCKVAGEEGSESEEMLRDWTSRQLPDFLEKFSPGDILNADGTGLTGNAFQTNLFL